MERIIILNHLSIHVGCVFFLPVAPLARRVAGRSDSEAEPGDGSFLFLDWDGGMGGAGKINLGTKCTGLASVSYFRYGKRLANEKGGTGAANCTSCPPGRYSNSTGLYNFQKNNTYGRLDSELHKGRKLPLTLNYRVLVAVLYYF